MDLSPSLETLGYCPFGAITGKPCLLCGGTRAVLSAASLDFRSALNYNAFVILVGSLVALVALCLSGANQTSRRERRPGTALAPLTVSKASPLIVVLVLGWLWNFGRW